MRRILSTDSPRQIWVVRGLLSLLAARLWEAVANRTRFSNREEIGDCRTKVRVPHFLMLARCRRFADGTRLRLAGRHSRIASMSDVTRILSQIESGDPSAAEQLLPLVYDELRRLAAAKLAQEKPGHTLQATALVHEAYLRLVGGSPEQNWDSRGHFFGAAAEAMRRILVESARRKQCLRHGGELHRHDLDVVALSLPKTPDELVALSEALDRLAETNAPTAELVKLRFFAGLTNAQAAAALGVSPRKANQIWAYAKAWLLESLGHEPL